MTPLTIFPEDVCRITFDAAKILSGTPPTLSMRMNPLSSTPLTIIPRESVWAKIIRSEPSGDVPLMVAMTLPSTSTRISST